MRLEKEDIQFIDTYLENSDVVFADIRMEMVDHVASDIENRMNNSNTNDFYNEFKAYMVEHKAQLLKDNRQFLKSADRKIWKALVKEFLTPITLILFLASCFGFYVLHKYLDLETFKLYVSFVPLVGLIGFLLTYVFYQNLKKLQRFSVVERLAFPFFALYQLTTLTYNLSKRTKGSDNIIWFIVGVSLVLTLMIIMFKVSIKLFKSYERQYKALV